jgi:hypothetical protein
VYRAYRYALLLSLAAKKFSVVLTDENSNFHTILRNVFAEQKAPCCTFVRTIFPRTKVLNNLWGKSEQAILSDIYKNPRRYTVTPQELHLASIMADHYTKDLKWIEINTPNGSIPSVPDYQKKTVLFLGAENPLTLNKHKSSELNIANLLSSISMNTAFNLLYRPTKHVPLDRSKLSKRAILCGNVPLADLIDRADVVVTHDDGLAYAAILRGTPVVALSPMLLWGSGLVYENKTQATLPVLIKEAFKFYVHRPLVVQNMALLGKYYFVQSGRSLLRNVPFGRENPYQA